MHACKVRTRFCCWLWGETLCWITGSMELLLSQLQNGPVHSLDCHDSRWRFHHLEGLDGFPARPTLPPHALVRELRMGMVECLYTQVTDEVKCMVININYDKAIIVVDTTLRVPSHVHSVKDWDRYPLLLSIWKPLEGAPSLYLKEVIIGALQTSDN